ncbi:MAG: hypothetical protein J4G05_05820, partial [Chlorobi bacterium]|nr:hypothetical protein [Chlorobiota bacterium]
SESPRPSRKRLGYNRWAIFVSRSSATEWRAVGSLVQEPEGKQIIMMFRMQVVLRRTRKYRRRVHNYE